MRVKKIKMIDSYGDTINVLPVGTRVRHKKHRNLKGKIVAHEYHEGGKISPLPYKVYWDNGDLAARLIGFMSIYPTVGSVEVSST